MNINSKSERSYCSFPSPQEWIVDQVSMSESVDILAPIYEGLERLPKEICQKAISVIKDAAALETGAIEGLYHLDRGITITAATEGAILSAAFQGQSEHARALIESQLSAYDFVLDLVTRSQPIAEAWIRQLHEVICRAQVHRLVRAENGQDEQRILEKGIYKNEENHVLTSSGRVHSYCPVNEVAQEMQKLVDTLRSDAFEKLHAVDQVAYAHYAFVAIHPFSDGNGRVARALSSVFSYRKYRVPLLITADQKSAYFDALEFADSGNYAAFRRFVRDRIGESILLLAESVRAAEDGLPSDSIKKVRQVYETKGGYSHVEIDRVGFDSLQQLEKFLKEEIERPENKTAGFHWSVSPNNAARDDFDVSKFRRPISASRQLIQLRGQMMSPADAIAEMLIGVVVPRDAVENDNILIECGNGYPDLILSIPVRSLLPTRHLTADIALKVFAGRVMSRLVSVISAAGLDALRSKGY